jgi:hypothetical protein
MSLDLGPLKAVVKDLEEAAANVGADLVNQESGVAQSDLDALTNALQGVHSKLAPVAPAPAAGDSEAPAPVAAAEGSGSAGAAGWTPPPAPEG